MRENQGLEGTSREDMERDTYTPEKQRQKREGASAPVSQSPIVCGLTKLRELLRIAPLRQAEDAPWTVLDRNGRLVAYFGPIPPDPNPVRSEREAGQIVAAVNSLPALLDVAAILQVILSRHGGHLPWCPVDGPCEATCADTRAALDVLSTEPEPVQGLGDPKQTEAEK